MLALISHQESLFIKFIVGMIIRMTMMVSLVVMMNMITIPIHGFMVSLLTMKLSSFIMSSNDDGQVDGGGNYGGDVDDNVDNDG